MELVVFDWWMGRGGDLADMDGKAARNCTNGKREEIEPQLSTTT